MPAGSPERRPGKYLLLLASLLLMVVIRPLVVGQYFQGHLIDTVTGGLILGFAALLRRRVLAIALVLFTLAVASSWALYLVWNDTSRESHRAVACAGLLFGMAFMSFICGAILHEVLGSTPVTWNSICGAICVYLLAGAIWAHGYTLVFLLAPGSFTGQPLDLPADSPTVLDQHASAFLYYSFATLATLGMGDIVPTIPLTRALSWLEAVIGQLYLAVLVARLVAFQSTPTGSSATQEDWS